MNLFTTTTVQELFTLDGLNLIIELTGSDKARGEILESKPPGVSFMDFRGARLLFDLVHLELEKTKLENESQRILDSLPYRIMVVNMDMAIEAVNRTFLRKFGLRNEDVLGKRCHEVRYALNIPCSEDKIVCFQETRLEELKKKGLISTYKEYTDKNGNTRYDVIMVTPLLARHQNLWVNMIKN